MQSLPPAALYSSGRRLRAFCPFHGSDKQRSLSIDKDTGRFNCFNCGAWGYTEEKRQEFLNRKQNAASSSDRIDRGDAKRQFGNAIPINKLPVVPPDNITATAGNLTALVPISDQIKELYEQYRQALPGSPGEEYLKTRGISLETAEACGLGFSSYGKWAHRSSNSAPGRIVRDWKGGRLVFPHTDPQGNIVNLYGRAIGTSEEVPKELRHDHLAGAKGYFNGKFLDPAQKNSTVYVCEGPFDAISLIEAGFPETVAIFGVFGWRWEWARFVQKMVITFDADDGGGQWKKIAEEGMLRGREVYYLPPEAYTGGKDLNEVWVRHRSLKIDSP